MFLFCTDLYSINEGVIEIREHGFFLESFLFADMKKLLVLVTQSFILVKRMHNILTLNYLGNTFCDFLITHYYSFSKKYVYGHFEDG